MRKKVASGQLLVASWKKLAAFSLFLLATPASAAPTQEEVFRSISSSVDSKADSSMIMAMVFGFAAIGILLLLVNQRYKRQVAPKALNHKGKLMKEVIRGTNIKSAEMKRLKSLAAQLEATSGETLNNPLTLLLCPSLLQKAMKKK